MKSSEASSAGFELDVPEFFNYTRDVFEPWARDPDRVALLVNRPDWSGFDEYTFEHLRKRVNQFCHVLRRLGITAGDRILVLTPWSETWYVAMLAMIKMGVVAIPTTTQARSRDLAYRFEASGAVGVIASPELRAVVDETREKCSRLEHLLLAAGREAPEGWLSMEAEMVAESTEIVDPPRTRSDDDLLIYFTSGTTAQPKMVLHTQASYGVGHANTARYWHDLRPEDTHWTMTDTGWAKAAWGSLFGQWTVGCKVLVNAAAKFEPQRVLDLIGQVKVTSFCAAPTAYRILVCEDLSQYDLSSLRHCTSAGEPLNAEVIRIWKEGTGAEIYDGYGQTETVNLVANHRSHAIKPGSMGRPVPGFDIRILDEDGRELSPGCEGLLAVRVRPTRPVGLFKTYVDNPEAMAESFRGDYYFTGDRAYRDGDGYLWFVSRNDDVIITSGYRIGPFEIESVLLEHPAVVESAVVASPDQLRGEIVKAFVVLADGYAPSAALVGELQKYVRDLTAPYKYPRKIEFVKTLPKTISGKIRRADLRNREWAAWRLAPHPRRPRKRRRYRRAYRRLGLRGFLERLRRSWFC